MIFHIILLLLMANTFCIEVRRFKRVINGVDTHIQEVPYFATVVDFHPKIRMWLPLCGASILSEYWLISAAHCFRNDNLDLRMRTGFNAYEWAEGIHRNSHLHVIDVIVSHPFSKKTNYSIKYDIALIKLRYPLRLVRHEQWPILLTNPKCKPSTGQKIKITGLGPNKIIRNGTCSSNPYNILFGTLVILSQKSCSLKYPLLGINSKIICATSRQHRASPGDSGGPVVWNSQLVGIISRGSCGRGADPDFYTALYLSIDWIQKTTGINKVASRAQC